MSALHHGSLGKSEEISFTVSYYYCNIYFIFYLSKSLISTLVQEQSNRYRNIHPHLNRTATLYIYDVSGMVIHVSHRPLNLS